MGAFHIIMSSFRMILGSFHIIMGAFCITSAGHIIISVTLPIILCNTNLYLHIIYQHADVLKIV